MPPPYMHSGDYIAPSLCKRGDTLRFTSPNGPVDYTVVDVIRDDEARGVVTLRLDPVQPTDG